MKSNSADTLRKKNPKAKREKEKKDKLIVIK